MKKVRINFKSEKYNANWKNTNKKRTNYKSFSNQKIQNVVKNIFQNKIKQIKKNTKLLQNILTQVKKRDYLKND